jgi:hypothetical protein
MPIRSSRARDASSSGFRVVEAHQMDCWRGLAPGSAMIT